ncbi:MAG: patatin-like phospholipase family protein [Hydrogenophaga sp.]|nr:patatin-like phospholipase family protein [Hydrogenophaga sp.]
MLSTRPLAVLCLSLALLPGLWPAQAVAADTGTTAAPARPRVGLVLSGGGARGLSHVGVLKVLEAARVPVDLIVGTSMGAIIGGLYASGMTADELEREILALEWGSLFDSREPRQLLSQRRKEEDLELSPVLRLGFRDGAFRLPTGAVSTRALETMLRRYTLPARHRASFDGLPTPFRAVATDMETGQAVVMDHGDLAAALRASMSVPGVFSPLELDGRILGDGGLVNNLPVDVARRMGADVIIAVSIGTPLAGRETLGSLLGITTQMVNILTEQNVQASIATLTTQDLLLQPPLGTLSSANFNRAPELVRLGTEYAESVREALNRFAVSPVQYADWVAQRQAVADTGVTTAGSVGALRFEGVDASRAQRLSQMVESEPGQPIDLARIEDDVQQLAATGDYEQVDYRLERIGSSRDEALVVRLRENRWGPNYFRLGLDLRTDFDGQGAFNLRLSHNRHWVNRRGAEWRNRFQLGETLGAFTEFYQPLDRRANWFVSAWADASLKRVDVFDAEGQQVATGKRRGLQVGADIGWPIGLQGSLGELRLGLVGSARRAAPDLVSSSVANQSLDLSTQRWRETGLHAALISDQLDYANFPSSGHRLKGDLVFGRLRNSGNSSEFVRLDSSFTAVRSWGEHTFNLGARLAYVNQIPLGALDEYSLGGFQNLSGYRVGQVAGNHLLFGRITYYRRMPWNVGVARAVFAGGSLEAGNAWLQRSDISFKGLRTGSSVFIGADTGVGPFYLSLVHAARGYTGLYLLLGRP